jgi:anaphase-promoting complex subunit 3
MLAAKAREIKRGPRGITAAAAVTKTASPSSDDEMMSVDTNASAISTLDTGDISRWEIAQQHLAEQHAVTEADAYILELVRIFARAVQAMARFQCEEVIEQLDLLPLEQQYSPTVMTLLGRAFFEMLDYVKVCRRHFAFCVLSA